MKKNLIIMGFVCVLLVTVAGCGKKTTEVDVVVDTTMTDTTATDKPVVDAAVIDATADTADTSVANKTLIDQVKAIREDGYVKGNPNARFTILEYSDIECPFCKQHFTNGTLNRVLEAYPDQVNIVFRHFPLNFHPNAQKAAEASECAAELGDGATTFYAFLQLAFTLPDLTQGSLTNAARTAGLDETAFTTCLTSGKYATKIMNQQTEGSLFGVNGTPGNVIFDNQSGKFALVSGAFPFEKFDEEIKKLM